MKHIWKKNKDGTINEYAWDSEYHCGVVCEICGETVCILCNPNYMELDDCQGENKNEI